MLAELTFTLVFATMGMVVGSIVGKESGPRDFYIDIKPSTRGFTERYWPRFLVAGPGSGGFDKEMMRTFGELNVGDKVKLAWTYDERKRAVQVQVIARAKPGRASKEGKSDPTP